MSASTRKILLYSFILVPLVIIFIAGHVIAVAAAEEVEAMDEEARKWAFIGAGVAVAASTFNAAWALRAVAIGGTALLTERPEQFGAVLLLGGLAEGVAIYGLLVAILILGKI